jgi:hypothetical protein
MTHVACHGSIGGLTRRVLHCELFPSLPQKLVRILAVQRSLLSMT